MVLAYRQHMPRGTHVDGIYRPERRANGCLQAKGSKKDKVGKERLYELCQIRLSPRVRVSRVAFKVRNVNDAELQGVGEEEHKWVVRNKERRKGVI
jgi:hypothetical protein